MDFMESMNNDNQVKNNSSIAICKISNKDAGLPLLSKNNLKEHSIN